MGGTKRKAADREEEEVLVEQEEVSVKRRLDFDNDSDIDLVVSSSDPRESLKLFWNDGTGKFTDGSKAANLHAMFGGLNLTQTDFNNDGHIDIFVMRGGWLAGAELAMEKSKPKIFHAPW